MESVPDFAVNFCFLLFVVAYFLYVADIESWKTLAWAGVGKSSKARIWLSFHCHRYFPVGGQYIYDVINTGTQNDSTLLVLLK